MRRDRAAQLAQKSVGPRLDHSRGDLYLFGRVRPLYRIEEREVSRAAFAMRVKGIAACVVRQPDTSHKIIL